MKRLLLTLCVVLAGACTRDAPTEVGSGLLPPDAIRTFEIVLGPERFLRWDTAFGLYSLPADADFGLLAREYEGVLNSRILLRYVMPRAIVVRDAAGVLRTDSTPSLFAGSVRLVVDTLADPTVPAQVALYRTTEDWDRRSATWVHRVDTLGVRLPWAQPGGSPGELISTTPFDAESADSVILAVDSATLALWSDTLNVTRGALVDVTTAGARLRTTIPVLRVQARSDLQPDTVVEVTVSPGRTFIFEPSQPESVGTPRVGGTPSWRTVLRLRERLDTVVVACPGVAGCAVRLGDLTVNYAALQLQPVPAPAGFAPELPLGVALHALLPSDLLPLERSPLTAAVGLTASAIPRSRFITPGAPTVEIAATDFLRLIFTPPDSSETFRPSHFALLQSGTIRTFGFGTFAELPSLRLIVTLSQELQLP